MTFVPRPVLSVARHRVVVVVTALLLLCLTGVADWITGPELPFTLFYLVPVCYAVWMLGRAPGLTISVAAAAMSVWTDIATATYSRPNYALWNGAIRLAFFVTTVFLLSLWKELGTRLGRMVEQRTSELRHEIDQRERATAALKELATQLSAAEQAERRRIAYDIHDSLGQMLTFLKLNLESLHASANSDASAAAARLDETLEIVEALIRQTRALTFELHPAMLDDLGLTPTLQTYAMQFEQRTQVEVTVSEHGERRPLPLAMANYMFRAVKELMNNAVKHGRAREIVIGLHWEPGVLRIVVDDDGCGFDPQVGSAAQGGGKLGLAGIRERLSSFGGSMRAESGAQQGARIILETPLN